MAFKSKGTDPKDQMLEEATAELKQLRTRVGVLVAENAQLKMVPVGEIEEADFITTLLSLEQPTIEFAASYPDGPNCDAVKAALRNASHGIAHVRKALDANARVHER